MGGLGLMQEQISQQNHDEMGADGNRYDAFQRPIGEWNCRHFASYILLGASPRRYTDAQLKAWKEMNHKGCTIGGKHYTVYEASQLMRQLETKVRQQKDIANLAKLTGDDKLRREAQAKIVTLKAQYKVVSEASGLKQRAERMVVEGYGKNKSVAKYQKDGIIESGNGGSAVTINSIDSPIEQRHTGKGNPNAILHFDISLNNRQQELLNALPEYNSRTIISKGDVSMTDLSALTAKTGDEFAMFTKEGARLIVRGNGYMVEITPEEAYALGKDGYAWSGHTHPGTDLNVLQPSSGDYAVLNQFPQENSSIYNSVGAYLIFERTEPYV